MHYITPAFLPCFPAGILLACNDKGSVASSLKIEALLFMRLAMEKNEPEVWQPHLQALMPGVLVAAAERYYKVRLGMQQTEEERGLHCQGPFAILFKCLMR